MLEITALSVSYGAHRALEDVALRIGRGEIRVILGANGAGKSSLLKAIGGLIATKSGARIAIDGTDVSHAKPHEIVEAGIALVPEGRGIFGDLTVAENLTLGAWAKRARTGEAAMREAILKLFPRLAERQDQIARTMSGGEQQMVAIGRALMSNPKILMLDEPSLGLSPLLTKELFRGLERVRETGVGILLVEQNARQSLAIADHGYLLENGHITGEGPADRLAKDPAVQAAYLGGAEAKGTTGAVGQGTLPAPSTQVRAPVPALDPAALAMRASAIQRAHIAHKAGRSAPAIPALPAAARSTLPAQSTGQAGALARTAAEMAARADRILKAHVIALRPAELPALPKPQERIYLPALVAAEGDTAKKEKPARKAKAKAKTKGKDKPGARRPAKS